MGTEIKAWQIIDGKLTSIDTSLKNEGRTEPYDLEPWLASNPEIIGTDIMIIGRQVMTKSGPIDLLGIDSSGNTVVIEIKRSELPRETLAQAVDYAASIAEWTPEKLAEVCLDKTGKTFDDVFDDAFPEINLESINLNSTQRIILVGFSIETALERMIEWLSDSYGVSINAIVLSYVKTNDEAELLMKTSIISEEMEQERIKAKAFIIPKSDEPGSHEDPILKRMLLDYLSRDRKTNKRMRDVIFPALLNTDILSRDELKNAFKELEPNCDESKVGYYISSLSSQLSMKKNDFLRQVISYKYHPHRPWEKDEFQIRPEYKDRVKEILKELGRNGRMVEKT